MTRRRTALLPGFESIYGFVCPICDRARPKGARYVKRRGEPVCVECCPGADDE